MTHGPSRGDRGRLPELLSRDGALPKLTDLLEVIDILFELPDAQTASRSDTK